MFSELGLNERILKAIDKLGYQEATDIQQQAIPYALLGKDLYASAETGSGKTAAFLLPMLHRMQEKPAPQSGARGLILVPTRELAKQVSQQFADLASFTYIKAGTLVGGEDFKVQKAQLRKNPEIVIATPGRLLEHLDKGSFDLDDIETLVLDEADRMLDMGFKDDVMAIAERCATNRQTLMFSATLDHPVVEAIARTLLVDAQVIRLSSPKQQHELIQHQRILSDDSKHKSLVLNWLLGNETYQKAVVFTNTRVEADRLGGLMRYHKHKALVLHGEKTQEQRNNVIGQFRSGQTNVLIASDIAARGLDVEGVDLVISFDMPRSGDDYIHRSGRTGRAGQEGLSIVLIGPQEWNLMSSIERYLRMRFEARGIKGLESSYKGPKKVKASGKAAGSKKKKALSKQTKGKGRPAKSSGKPAKKTNKASSTTASESRPSSRRFGNNDGSSPLRRRPQNDS